MKAHDPIVRVVFSLLLLWLILPTAHILHGAEPGRQIPDQLKSWQDWATWDDQDRAAPTPFQDPGKHLSVWPSVLNLHVDHAAGQFDLTLTVFHEAWVALPGSQEVWPVEVKTNGAPVAVVEHDGKPSVHLGSGIYHLTGNYRW
ncbi:MAG TPA: hypothetical protein VGC39_05085, partial [Candidatus Methylacidiphilales bacterium]